MNVISLLTDTYISMNLLSVAMISKVCGFSSYTNRRIIQNKNNLFLEHKMCMATAKEGCECVCSPVEVSEVVLCVEGGCVAEG